MKKHTLFVIYTCTHKKLEPVCWYNTGDSDAYYLKDKTNNVYVRVPWSSPTQRDLKSFAKGYSFGKGMNIEFETIIKEW